ncbi:MAG: hypothetical protein J6Y51_06225 [Bacteroidaceae bacterium]|nr:hypothetical protein [Bacteroidaceae bacterium]
MALQVNHLVPSPSMEATSLYMVIWVAVTAATVVTEKKLLQKRMTRETKLIVLMIVFQAMEAMVAMDMSPSIAVT